MLRKILKWTGLFIVFIIAGVATATALRQHLTYEAPFPDIKASTDSAVIATGKNIALVTKGCVHCHSPINNIDSMLKNGEEPSLAGAKKFETPFGTFFTPNLTPDKKTGIGNMTDGAIARLLRYGVKNNGEAALPFMQGLDMSDADMTALISYLRSLNPVESKTPENEFNLLGRFAKAFIVKPSIPQQPAIARN
jgi:cbb3-type cytochrome oxidase cytochrome c subunit